MSTPVFLILTGDEKYDVLDPQIIGPFESEDAAVALLERHPQWNGVVLEPFGGGYAGWAIASADTADNPSEVEAEWAERYERSS